jgi:hypothetical protein
MARFIKKIGDFLKKHDTNEVDKNLDDNLNSMFNFIKSKDDQLKQWVKYSKTASNYKYTSLHTIGGMNDISVHYYKKLQQMEDILEFEINNDSINTMNGNIRLFDIQWGKLYIANDGNDNLVVVMQLKLDDIVNFNFSVNRDNNPIDFYIIKDSYFYSYSTFKSSDGDFVKLLEKYALSSMEFLITKLNDSFLHELNDRMEYIKRVELIHSKYDDIADILVDLSDLSDDFKLIKNRVGGLTARLKISDFKTVDISSEISGYSINLYGTALSIFDILLEVKPRIYDLIGDFEFNIEFKTGEVWLYIGAKK